MSERIIIKTGHHELSALTTGSPSSSALLLVHGWPLTSAIWEPVIERLGERHHVLAFDLPGIGASSKTDIPVLKTEIAALLLDAAEAVEARDITIAGVDVGGMIAYSAARDLGERISRSVIMNTVIPGIEPWAQVLAIPQVWHFAFHQTPNLPELLVAGREREYFDFFLDMLSGDSAKITAGMREEFVRSYRDPSSLKTGFDWYRSMPDDARINGGSKQLDTPLLYIRGDADPRPIGPYLEGLRAGGATNVTGEIVADRGEIVSLEQPDALVELLLSFADDAVTATSDGNHLPDVRS